MKHSFLVLLITLFFTKANVAQTVNALTIVYDVSYPTKIPTMNAIYFKQCIMSQKGYSVSCKYYTQDNGISTSVTNDCNESTYNSFPYKDDMQMKVSKDGLRSAFKMETPNVIITNETKEILGLKCKKVVSETKNVVGDILRNTYYITEKMDSTFCPSVSVAGLAGWMFGCEPIKYPNGILLLAEIDMGKGAIQLWTAKSIGYKPVPTTDFSIPQKPIMTYDEYNEKIRTDKSFRKEMTKEIRNDKTAEFNKQVWASLMKDLEPYLKQALVIATNVAENLNATNGQNKSESLAITNPKKDGNSPEGIACSKEAKSQWEASKEYHDFYDNRNNINSPQLRNGELAKAKYADILLQHCSQYLSNEEKAALTAQRDNCLKTASELNGNTINTK
jgi:hypothetical protein